MIHSGDCWEGMIQRNAGEVTFCRFCRARHTCKREKDGIAYPRILPGVRLVLGYLMENLRGVARYPWPGDHRMQAQWFNELYAHAGKIHREATTEKLERGQNEKQQR